MRSVLLPFLCFYAAVSAASVPTRDEAITAFGVILDDPRIIGTTGYEDALKIVRPVLQARLPNLNVPDGAVAWVPETGPCGGPGSPLLIAFFGSVVRDDLEGKHDGAIYRGWLCAIRHYRILRATFPEDYPAISAMEVMIAKDAAGTLHAEAALLERHAQEPNPSPDPNLPPPAMVRHVRTYSPDAIVNVTIP